MLLVVVWSVDSVSTIRESTILHIVLNTIITYGPS
jgi:hypothetical protein